MWNRRKVLGSCLVLAASSGIARAQAPGMSGMGMPGMGQGPMTRESCIDICIKSHQMCLETARYCFEKGGDHVAPTHLALLLDCAEMCQMTANSLMRRSPQHGAICGACADLLTGIGRPVAEAPPLATGIDALTDGLWLRTYLSTETMDREGALAITARFLAAAIPEHAEDFMAGLCGGT